MEEEGAMVSVVLVVLRNMYLHIRLHCFTRRLLLFLLHLPLLSTLSRRPPRHSTALHLLPTRGLPRRQQHRKAMTKIPQTTTVTININIVVGVCERMCIYRPQGG